jgi:hypothetical protein
MIRRILSTVSFLAVAAWPLAAQRPSGSSGLPAGWAARTDEASAKLADVTFVATDGRYHVTSGPAAIYWSQKDRTAGPFSASATFTQQKNPTHPEAYGLFFMGNKLDTPDQSYAYVLVRGDGKVMVKHRAGKEVHTIIDWTDNAAVHKADAKGVATNTLAVDATKPDSVRVLVNGRQIAAIPGAHVGSTDGVVGLRVNHNLDVAISDFRVTPKR